MLSLSGPTRQDYQTDTEHILVLGQRFFSNFPFSVIVDRASNTYVLSIGGASNTDHDKHLLTVIFTSMSIVVVILMIVIYKMI